jgi:hypothetical protein
MVKRMAVVAFVLFNLTGLSARAQNSCGSLDQGLTTMLDTVVSFLPPQAGETPAALTQELLRNLRSVPGGCSALKTVGAEADKIQLHVSINQGRQVLFVAYKGTIDPARIFRASLGQVFGKQFTVKNPVFSLSRTDVSINKDALPGGLTKIINESLLGLPMFDIKGGFQVAAGVTLDGASRELVETAFGATGPFKLRAGIVSGGLSSISVATPSGAAGGGSAGLDAFSKYKAYKEGEEKAAAGKPAEPPELFVEITPKGAVKGPFSTGVATFTDSTFLITSNLTAGYTGNITFPKINKKFVAFMEAPFKPDAGKMDFLGAKFGLATPELTLRDLAYLNAAVATMGGVAFMPQTVANGLNTMATPLSVFVVSNPVPVPTYTLSVPFPGVDAKGNTLGLDVFNIAILGPTASLGSDNGPKLRLYGNAKVLGQAMGKMNVDLSPGGLKGSATENVSINLGPLGTQSISMTAATNITPTVQNAGVTGNVLGRFIDFGMSGNTVSMVSPATCATPVALSGSASINSSLTTIVITGINFDPKQIANCTGEALKAAYRWIGNQGAKLGGYTAVAAQAALNAIENPAQVVQTFAQVTSLFKAGNWKPGPPRTAYDCTTFDATASADAAAFVNTYPPGRIWGSHEDFDHKGMSYTRYIFSPVDNMFHPLSADFRVLGSTQCGGLVAEGGLGNGRLNVPDDQIWAKGLMCERNQFPKALVNPAVINTTPECYAWRGMQTAHPELWGRMVQVNGRPEWFIYTQNGHIRQIAPNQNCGNSVGDIIHPSLHELYQIPLDGPAFDAAQCVASKPPPAPNPYDKEKQAQANQSKQIALNMANEPAAKLKAAMDPKLAVLDPRWYLTNYSDLYAAFGGDLLKAQDHWLANGIREGRQSSATFSIAAYLRRYPDLQNAFGANNYAAALNHYISNGRNEGRSAAP